jgi:hypothetical protein
MIKIYSHPRSGTHFLEAFIAENFYEGKNLSSNGPIFYGHWSDKKLLEEGEPHHQLFGSHFFPNELKLKNSEPKIYIYRDVRAVIASVYNSKYYNIKEFPGLSFSEFLRMDIDWYGGLGRKKSTNLNIVQHWDKHVNEWLQLKDQNLLIIRYEKLKLEPEKAYDMIARKYFKSKRLLNTITRKKIKKINHKVGLNPNEATIDAWKNLFSEKDLEFVQSNLTSVKYLYNEKG